MTITEYLKRKYNRESPSITQMEAYIFGVKYPLKEGWFSKIKDKKITTEMATKLIDYFKTVADKTKRVKLAIRLLTDLINENGMSAPNNKQVKNVKLPVKPQPTKETVVGFINSTTIDPTLDSFLNTFEWKAIRKMALNLHGSRCQCCGVSVKDGAVLNVDHIKPRKFFPHLALDINNLQVLCSDCNHGKGNWDMTDSRTT